MRSSVFDTCVYDMCIVWVLRSRRIGLTAKLLLLKHFTYLLYMYTLFVNLMLQLENGQSPARTSARTVSCLYELWPATAGEDAE